MIALNWLEELISYAIASPYVKGEIPVSLMILSEIEAGKTAVLAKFGSVPSVIYESDFTRYGLLTRWLEALERREKRTIIVPDMVALMESKNQSGKGALLGFLTSLTEEGMVGIDTFQLRHVFSKPLRCNIIIGAPKSVTEDNRRWKAWKAIGITSRLLPITYRYNSESVSKILEYLMHREYKNEGSYLINLPTEDKEIALEYKLANQLLNITQQVAKAIGTYGFRIQRQAQTLAMARALLNGRDAVNQEDADRVNELLSWANLKFEPVRM